MRILLIGLLTTYNLGDPILLHCAKTMLQKMYPDAEIGVRNIHGYYAIKKYRVPSPLEFRRNCMKKKLKNAAASLGYRDPVYSGAKKSLAWDFENGFDRLLSEPCDLVLFAGGQMFMDPLVLPLSEIVRSCEKRRIPVIFHACGFGPLYSRKIRGILWRALQNKAVLSVTARDFPPERLRRGSGFDWKTGISFSADMGLWASEVYGVPARKGFSSGKTVGIGVIGTVEVSLKQEAALIRKLIDLLEKDGRKWQLFTNGHPQDEMAARFILKSIKHGQNNHLQDALYIPKTPPELVQKIASYDSIISSRLHSHILAASLNVPSVALSWDAKVNRFFEKAGCGERCFSFSERPGTILAGLKEAEVKGWDQNVIQKLRQESLETLTDCINNS